MSEDFLAKRRLALEESFFRKRDADLIDRLKQEMQADAKRNELAVVSGIRDEKLLDRLIEMDLGADTVAALSLVPLVRVAWADKSIKDKERTAILSAAVEAGLHADSASYHWLMTWLDEQPDAELNEAWTAYVGELCKTLGSGDREALKLGIVKRAQQVAEAAGGILGLGNKVSAAEQMVLDELQAAFG